MPDEVVITGMGIVSPIGCGEGPFWESLCTGRSGTRFVEGLDTSELSRKVRRVFFPLMAALGALAVLLYPVLLRILGFGQAFHSSWLIFGILMAGIVANSRVRPFLGILLQSGRPGMHTLLVGGVVLTNFLLNLVLIPLIGAPGAAAATACAFLVEAALITVLARRLAGIAL